MPASVTRVAENARAENAGTNRGRRIMVSNGNQGNSPPKAASHLHIVGAQQAEQFQCERQSLKTQTLSFSTSTEHSINRISQMAEKGYKLTAMAGQDGKLAAVFSKHSQASNSTVIATADADGSEPAFDYAYRLSSQTLEQISHNGNSWLLTYAKERKYKSQKVLKSEPLDGMLEAIKGCWRQQYRITSVAFGNSYWLAVATQLPQLHEQSFFTASDIESLQARTKQAWQEGRTICAITFGDDKWLVVLNKEKIFKPQKWYTRKCFIDLRAKTREEWQNGFRVSCLAKAGDMWLAVVSKP